MSGLIAPTTPNAVAPVSPLTPDERRAFRVGLAGPSARELWQRCERPGANLPLSEPESSDDSPTCLLLRIKSKVDAACANSRLVLAGADGGKTHLIAVGCGRNSCGYCGRKKARRFMRRVGERLDLDKVSGLEQQTRTLFVTFTLRRETAGQRAALSVAESFKAIHKAVAFALRSVRRPRKGGRIWRGVTVAAWPGLVVEFANNVDVTAAGMAHAHVLVRVRALPGAHIPTDKAIQARLHNDFNRAVYNHLGRRPLPFYRGGMAVGGVDVQPSRDKTAAAKYMALHNGKVWHGEWAYPDRFRRLATSRRFLLSPEKTGGELQWTLVKKPLWCCTAALAQVGIESDVLGPSHAVVNLPRDNNLILRYVDGVSVKTVPRAQPLDPDLGDALRAGLAPDEWREYRADGVAAIATPYKRPG